MDGEWQKSPGFFVNSLKKSEGNMANMYKSNFILLKSIDFSPSFEYSYYDQW